MKVSIKTPILDLEIDDVKSLDDVLKFVAELKKIEGEKPKAAKAKSKKRPLKKKD